MKYLLLCLFLLAGICCYGNRHRHERGLPRTEVGLMNNVLGCLSNKDSVNYFNLFIPFDTLWQLVLHNPNKSPEATVQLNNIKDHPRALLEFDPAYNPAIMARFGEILRKGEDSGIHWREIVMQRYELYQENISSPAMRGYDIIAPERFMGYMFVRDLVGRLTFCISIAEIQKVDGYFFGGQVLNILEASSIDQFHAKEAAEQKYFEWEAQRQKEEEAHADSVRDGLIVADSTVAVVKKKSDLAIDEPNEDDTFKKRKEIVDRRYYEGKFDDEIPVRLYVRYMKDLRSNTITAYDGLYKFGDQVKYARLNISRDKDGVWTMDDDPPVGSMELELKLKVYTGSWTNNENQTGYDVVLTQRDITSARVQQFDKMLESGRVGSVDDETIETKTTTGKKHAKRMKRRERRKKREKDGGDDDEKPQKKKTVKEVGDISD